MAGHALVAFALAAAATARLDWDRRRALTVGLAAGAFAVVPDVDMLYAVWSAAGADAAGPLAVNEAFWTASQSVHRSATHSIVVAGPAAVAFGLIARRSRDPGRSIGGSETTPPDDRRGPSNARASGTRWDRPAAVAVLAAVVVAGFLASGALDAVMLGAFAVAGAAVAVAVGRRTDLSGREVTAAAAVGLFTHPFGDLFTGGPPHLLYPLSYRVFETRIALAPDPTVHLLATFALEVVAVWAAAAVYLGLTDRDRPVAAHVDRTAALGVAYAGAVLVVPAPTLARPELLVYSLVGVGVALSALSLARHPRLLADGGTDDRTVLPVAPESVADALLTGTAGVSVALVAYLAAYLLS